MRWSEARKFLSDSNQAVIPRAKRLAVLGARGKKMLHTDLQPDLVDEANELELSEQLQPLDDKLLAADPEQDGA